MSIRTVTCSVGAACILAGAGTAHAGDVVKIRATGCTLAPAIRSLTGFVLKGTRGVVTALHGVADCKDVIAISPGKNVAIALKVISQSAARDLALLDLVNPSDAAALATLEPFQAVTTIDAVRVGSAAVAVGFPHGVLTPQENARLTIGNPALERLGDIMGLKNQDLVARRSPDPDLRVIKVSGLIVKGESGAPLLLGSPSGQLAGIVIGSADPGASNIGWVAPISGVEWTPFSVSQWGQRPLPNSLASGVGIAESTGTRSYQVTVSVSGQPDVRATIQLGADGQLEQLAALTSGAGGSVRALTITDPTTGQVVAQATTGQAATWRDGDQNTHVVSATRAGDAVAVGVISTRPLAPTNLRIVN